MTHEPKTRFEVPLPASRHRELEELGRSLGLSPRDLARLAIARLLANPAVLTGTERKSAA